MKMINIKESLIKLDMETNFEHTLTDLYEACMLSEDKKHQLVQYIDDRDIPGMSAMLSNEAGVMTENISDDIPDDEMPELEGWSPDMTECPACGDFTFNSKKGSCNACSYHESLEESSTESFKVGDMVYVKPSKKLGRVVKVKGDYIDVEIQGGNDPDRFDTFYPSDLELQDRLNEGPLAVLGDLAGKGVGDAWKGIKNFAKGVKDTGKDIVDTAKAGVQAAKETRTGAKIRDAARAVKNADNLDQFKQDYKARQQKRTRSDAKRNTMYRGKMGSTIGDIQDWKFEVNGKKLSYDKFMQLPKDQRIKMLRSKQVKIYDIRGRETSLAAQENRLREKLLEMLLMEYSEYRRMLTEGVGPTHPEEEKISSKLMSVPGTTKVEFDWSNSEIYKVPENHLIILVFCRDGFDDPYFENRRKWKSSVMSELRGMGWTLEDPIEDNDSYLYLVMKKSSGRMTEATAVLDRPTVNNVHTHKGSFSGIIDAHLDEINDMINAYVPASHIVHSIKKWVEEANLTKANARYAQTAIMRMAKMRSSTEIGMYLYNIRLKAEDDSYGSIDSQIRGKNRMYEEMSNWTQAYDEFNKIADKHYTIDNIKKHGQEAVEDAIRKDVDALFQKNKDNQYYQQAYKRWNEREPLEEDASSPAAIYSLLDAADKYVENDDYPEGASEEEIIKIAESNPDCMKVTKWVDGMTGPDEVVWERPVDTWYVSKYEGGAEYEPAEGGYYYETLALADSEEFDSKEAAQARLAELASQCEDEIAGQNDNYFRVKLGKYIGDVEEYRVESKKGAYSEGRQVYEDLNESDEEDGPYSKEEIEKEIKSLTQNFTRKRDTLKSGYQEENDAAVALLKKHYKKVTSEKRGQWFELTFSDPISVKEAYVENPRDFRHNTEDGFTFDEETGKLTKIDYDENGKPIERLKEALNNYKVTFYMDSLDDSVMSGPSTTKMIQASSEEEAEKKLMDSSTDKYYIPTVTKIELVEGVETSKEWEHKDKEGKIGRIRQSDGKGDRKPLTRDQAKEIAKFRGHENDELYPVNESLDFLDTVTVTLNEDDMWGGYSRELEYKYGWYQGQVIFEDDPRLKQIGAKPGDTILCGLTPTDEFCDDCGFDVVPMKVLTTDELERYEVKEAKPLNMMNESKSINEAMIYTDTNGFLGEPGETYTMSQFRRMWQDKDSDPVMSGYDSFEEWVGETISQMDARPDGGDVSSTDRVWIDVDGVMGTPGEEWTVDNLADYWIAHNASDPVLAHYNGDWKKWIDDTIIHLKEKDLNESFEDMLKDPEVQSRNAEYAARMKAKNDKENELAKEAKNWPDDKELTYEEALAFAKAYYSQGGDGFYETTEKYQFDDMVNMFGPMTVGRMKRDFGVFDSVAKDRMGEGLNLNESDEEAPDDFTLSIWNDDKLVKDDVWSVSDALEFIHDNGGNIIKVTDHEGERIIWKDGKAVGGGFIGKDIDEYGSNIYFDDGEDVPTHKAPPPFNARKWAYGE